VKSGDALFRQGDRADAMYLILHGTIRVQANGVELALRKTGEGIGEIALLSRAPRSASCIAVQDTELLQITSSNFQTTVLQQANVAISLLRTLVRRLRQQTLNTAQHQKHKDVPEGDAEFPEFGEDNVQLVEEALLSSKASQFGEIFTQHEQALYQLFEQIAFLKKVPLFAHIAEPYLVSIARLSRTIHIDARTELFQQGTRGGAMYLLKRGVIRIFVNGIEVNQVSKGECIGEMSLIDSEPRSASCIAREECELLKITAEDFATLLQTQPEIGLALLQSLSMRLRGQIAKLATHQT
jgi:CRP-like cAMP-binding protein